VPRPFRLLNCPLAPWASLRRSGILLVTSTLLAACGAGDFAADTGRSLYTQMADQFATPRQYANDPLLYDGSYQGKTQLVSASGVCPEPRYGVVMIGDNVLTYAYTPQQVFTVPVLPDGTLHGVAGEVMLDGKIDSDHLDMTITSPTCTSQYATHFYLDHS
jgi:hypothetical protein